MYGVCPMHCWEVAVRQGGPKVVDDAVRGVAALSSQGCSNVIQTEAAAVPQVCLQEGDLHGVKCDGHDSSHLPADCAIF